MKQTIQVMKLFCALSILGTAPALAITNGDVMEEMNQDQRHSYISGLVDMFAYQEFRAGDEDRANCIYDWYYRSDDGIRVVWANLEAYPDHSPEPVIIILIENACP